MYFTLSAMGLFVLLAVLCSSEQSGDTVTSLDHGITPALRDSLVPAAVTQHYAGMPNNVRALYATFELRRWPHTREEVFIYDAHGQLCFDSAANSVIAYHMWNHMPDRGAAWRYVSWRVEMGAPPIAGGKLSGVAPEDFDVRRYVNP